MTATNEAPRRSRSVRIAAVAVGVIMVLLVALLITRKNADDRSTASPVVGKAAPALNGKAVVGDEVDMGATDRWTLVNFFATWCTPCVEEHPQLRKLAADGEEAGNLKVVSVVYDDKPAKVKEFFEKHGGDWSVLDYDDGRTALDWGVAKVPESFLVSPTGVVVSRYQGGVVAADVEATIDDIERQAAAENGGGS